jgi:uncharacterized protein (TIGR02466 family)
MFMSTDFNLVWATPIMRRKTESVEQANDLRDLILSCETAGFRKPASPQQHDGEFESTSDLLDWKDERAQSFRTYLLGQLGSFVKLVNEMDDTEINQLRFEHDCWFHITRDGGHFRPHNHPNAAWSAIYCVDPGDPTPKNDSAAGHVNFSDPRAANQYLDAANRDMRRDMSFNAIRLRFEPGELLIFPSYLQHYVEPYIGEQPRITIAANFWFRNSE